MKSLKEGEQLKERDYDNDDNEFVRVREGEEKAKTTFLQLLEGTPNPNSFPNPCKSNPNTLSAYL